MSRLLRKLPLFRVGPFLKLCVILGLSLYTASNVIDGPVKNFLRNGTIIRENELNLSGKTKLKSTMLQKFSKCEVRAEICFSVQAWNQNISAT